MRISKRSIALLTLAVAYAWCAVQVYRAGADPESRVDSDTLAVRLFASPGRPSARAGEARMRGAVETLNDRSRPARERLDGYRTELRLAEGLLLQSLRANPAEARTLARLAAVRWELLGPTAARDHEAFVAMMRVAARLAPRIPGVQRDVAELELRMGRRDDAIVHFRRTLELDPSRASGVVETLQDSGMTADEIADVLPSGPGILAAMGAAYRTDTPTTPGPGAETRRPRSADAPGGSWFAAPARRLAPGGWRQARFPR